MLTLDLAAAAAFLGLHPDTLRERAAAGIIPGAKVGKEWRFLEADLLAGFLHDEWLATYVDNGRIYVVEETADSPVKIGFSARGGVRVGELQMGNWRKLRLVRAWRGTLRLEGLIHHLLSEHRLHGEWFGRSDGLSRLLATTGDDAAHAIAAAFPERCSLPSPT